MSNVEGERMMAALQPGKTQERRVRAYELSQELLAAHGQAEIFARLIPAVMFLLDRYAQDS